MTRFDCYLNDEQDASLLNGYAHEGSPSRRNRQPHEDKKLRRGEQAQVLSWNCVLACRVQDADEVARKEALWDGMNKEYLEKLAAKQAARENAGADGESAPSTLAARAV